MDHRASESSSGLVSGRKSPPKIAPRADWDSHSTRLFCSIAASVLRAGYIDGITPTRSGWAKILSDFREATGRHWTKKQVSNKWQSLRRHFRIWKCIVGSGTDIGWDPVTGTVSSTPDWWEAQIAVYPEAKALRDGQIPNWDDLLTMFDDNCDYSNRGLSSQPPLVHPSRTSAPRNPDDCTRTPGSSLPALPTIPGSQETEPSPRALRAARRASQTARDCSHNPRRSPPIRIGQASTSLAHHSSPARPRLTSPGDIRHDRSRAEDTTPLPAHLPPSMAGYAPNRGNTSTGSKRRKSASGALNVDIQQEVLYSNHRQSQASKEEASVSSFARLQDTSIGNCLQILRGLAGFEEGSRDWLYAVFLIGQTDWLRELLVYACTTAETRIVLLRAQIARARADGFFNGL